MPDLGYLPAAEILLNERGKKVLRKNMFYSDLGDNLHVEGITVGSLFFKHKLS